MKGIKINSQLDGTYIVHIFASKNRYRANDFKELVALITHYYSGKHDSKKCPICRRIYK